MSKHNEEATVKNWEELLSAIRETDATCHNNLLKCKPERVNKRSVILYSALTPKQNFAYKEAIREASRKLWNHRVTVKWRDFPEGDEFLKEGHPRPSPLIAEDVQDLPREEFPLKAKIRGFYPNNRIILTELGNARCKDARAFAMGMEVDVTREGDWLFVKGLPKNKFRY